jgi:hypothetical protein
LLGPDDPQLGWPHQRYHGHHISPHLARLPDGQGGIRPVLVTTFGRLVDPESGASLGEMPVAADIPLLKKWSMFFGKGRQNSMETRMIKG